MEIVEINKDDDIYPKQLLNLAFPPHKIYAVGNVGLLKEELFSVVGSRKISDYGKKHCENICKELSLRNIPLVSGLAIGTDTVVHKTALKYGGKTIAVLPCGFNKIYPRENQNLFEDIIEENGLALSEYEINIEASNYKFLERNRIVAGLGVGTLVIEALKRSGTSVTAKYVFDLNKKVFAIPRKY